MPPLQSLGGTKTWRHRLMLRAQPIQSKTNKSGLQVVTVIKPAFGTKCCSRKKEEELKEVLEGERALSKSSFRSSSLKTSQWTAPLQALSLWRLRAVESFACSCVGLNPMQEQSKDSTVIKPAAGTKCCGRI